MAYTVPATNAMNFALEVHTPPATNAMNFEIADGTAPTVALNTPADSSGINDTTPTLNFTGTDEEEDDVEYQVQISPAKTTLALELRENSNDFHNNFDGTDTNISYGMTTTKLSAIFNGTSSKILITNTIASLSVFSIGLYVYTTDNVSERKYFVRDATSGTDWAFYVGQYDGKYYWGMQTDTWHTYYTLTTVGLNEWKSIIFTYDGTTAKLYVNTSLIDTQTPGSIVSQTSKPFKLGYLDTQQFHSGSLFNFFVFDYVISEDERNALFACGGVGLNYPFFVEPPGAETYSFPYALSYQSTLDSGFTSGHPFGSGDAIDFTIPITDELDVGTEYFWQVRAKDPLGSTIYGDWSAMRSFEVLSSSSQSPSQSPSLSPSSSVSPSEASTWYNASWLYRVKVTVLATEVDVDCTNFPVYCDLSDLPADFHTNVKANGADIRITKADGTTEIPREVVFYDQATDTGELHFKGDIDSDTDTDFYVYYGNSGATEPAIDSTYGAENVWSSDYEVVAHMQQDPSGGAPQILDSTTNDVDGTTNGSMASGDLVAGQLAGNALDLDSDDWINFGDNGDYRTYDKTVSIWVSTSDTDAYIVAKSKYGAESGRWAIGTPTTPTSFVNVGGTDSVMSSASAINSSWHLLTMVVDRNSYHKMYVDGQQVASNTGTNITNYSASDLNTANILLVGGYNDAAGTSIHASAFKYVGKVDELRVKKAADSAEWISTEYNNQSSPSTFYDVGIQEENTAASSSVSPSQSPSLSPSSSISPSQSPSQSPSLSPSSSVSPSFPPDVNTYYFDESDEGVTDPNNVWTNDANAFDSDATPSTYASTSTVGSVSSNYLKAEGTSAPSSATTTITQVRARMYGRSGWGSYLTLTAPTGGWDWGHVAALEIKCYSTSSETGNVSATVYTDGLGESLGEISSNSALPGSRVYKIEIEVTSDPVDESSSISPSVSPSLSPSQSPSLSPSSSVSPSQSPSLSPSSSVSPSQSPSQSPSLSPSSSVSPSQSPSQSPSLSPSSSVSPSQSPSQSPSLSPSSSVSPSQSPSQSPSLSPSSSVSPSQSPSQSPSLSPSSSISPSQSPSQSPSLSPSSSASPSQSPSQSPSLSPSSSVSPSQSPSQSPSLSPSSSVSPSQSPSQSPSLSPSSSASPSQSPSQSPSLSPSSSVSPSQSPSQSPSLSPSSSVSPSQSPSQSPSLSPSSSVSPSQSPSQSPSRSPSSSVSPSEISSESSSISPSSSLSPSVSPSLSASQSPSLSPSSSVSSSLSPSSSKSPSESLSLSPSASQSPSKSPSQSPSLSPSSSASPSQSPSASPSISPSSSKSPSQSPSVSPSLSPSSSKSPSQSPSESPSLSPSSSESPSQSPSGSPSFSPSASISPSVSPSQSPSLSPSTSQSPSQSPSISPSLSPSSSKSPSQSPSQSPSLSPSSSASPSQSPSSSQSPSISPSVSPSSSVSPSTSPSSSQSPSQSPSVSESESPSISPSPSLSPSSSVSPSQSPSLSPSSSESASVSPSPSPPFSSGYSKLAYFDNEVGYYIRMIGHIPYYKKVIE